MKKKQYFTEGPYPAGSFERGSPVFCVMSKGDRDTFAIAKPVNTSKESGSSYQIPAMCSSAKAMQKKKTEIYFFW